MSSRPAGRFVGNDVVDLAAAGERWDQSDARWVARHMTAVEQESLDAAAGEDRARLFWSLFAAKEAASKAFAQAGIETPRGGFRFIEVDVTRARVREITSGREASLFFSGSDDQKIHALALISEDAIAADEIVQGLDCVPECCDPSDYARAGLTRDAARRTRIAPRDAWMVGSVNEHPRFLVAGQWLDWSVSLSHSGRFAAWGCLLPPSSA